MRVKIIYATAWTTRELRFDYRQGKKLFLFDQGLGPTLEPFQRRVQQVPRVLFPALKQPGRLDDRSPPSIAEIKNKWRYTSASSCFHGVQSVTVTFPDGISRRTCILGLKLKMI
jgi:hypothetical protein